MAGRVVGYPERVVFAEATVVAGAVFPPVGVRVDHRVGMFLVGVLVGEVLDPRHHLRWSEPVALGAVRVELNVEGAGQGQAVAGPAAAVLDEVVSLGFAARVVRDGKVVSPPDHSLEVGTLVLVVEVGISVVSGLGGLCIGEVDIGRDVLPVDVALVGADVYPWQLEYSRADLHRPAPGRTSIVDRAHGVGGWMGDLLGVDRGWDEFRLGHQDLLSRHGYRPNSSWAGPGAGRLDWRAGHARYPDRQREDGGDGGEWIGAKERSGASRHYYFASSF